MQMNKTAISITMIVVVVLLAGFYMYSEHTRYDIYIQGVGGKPSGYLLDRKTGQIWMLHRYKRYLVKTQKEPKPVRELTIDEKIFVWGKIGELKRAGFSDEEINAYVDTILKKLDAEQNAAK